MEENKKKTDLEIAFEKVRKLNLSFEHHKAIIDAMADLSAATYKRAIDEGIELIKTFDRL